MKSEIENCPQKAINISGRLEWSCRRRRRSREVKQASLGWPLLGPAPERSAAILVGSDNVAMAGNPLSIGRRYCSLLASNGAVGQWTSSSRQPSLSDLQPAGTSSQPNPSCSSNNPTATGREQASPSLSGHSFLNNLNPHERTQLDLSALFNLSIPPKVDGDDLLHTTSWPPSSVLLASVSNCASLHH